MKINGLQPQDVYKSFASSTAHSEDNVVADKKSAVDVSADRVEISSESADLNEARNLVQQAGITDSDGSQTASRSEKVEALKQQVESGEYNVSSKDVANSIVTGRYLDSRA